MDTRARVEGALRASRLLGGLDDDVVSLFAENGVRRFFARGERIWRAGDRASCVAVIVGGLVKIVQRDGHEAIVALYGPHETFGEMAVLAGGRYSADAVAATRSLELVCIDADAVRSAFETRLAFAHAMGRALLDHSRALQEKIRIVSAGTVERRLATLLQHLLDRFGDELEDGSSFVPVALSRGELASLVGATIETTIRTMSRWQKEHLVSTGADGFVVHQPWRLEEVRSGGRALEVDRLAGE